MVSQLDEVDEVKCEPASDRISIDELALLNPRTGKVTINTGRGKHVLSINRWLVGLGFKDRLPGIGFGRRWQFTIGGCGFGYRSDPR